MKLKAHSVAFLFCLLCTGTAPAISIHDFARMKMDDQATYVTSLVEGSATMLKAQGQPDQAQKALALFKDPSKSGGLNQFVLKLKELEGLNNRNATNPNNRAPVYQIEDAMEMTLKNNGIIVPASFLLTINKNFTPSNLRLPQTIGQ